MAIDTRVKRKFDQVNDEGYLSDESAFYGDEPTKRSLEQRVREFSPQEWWENHAPYLNEVALENSSLAKPITKVTPYNPYEGHPCGRQMDESIEDFLKRLPPATTRTSDRIPWIFISNPFRPRPGQDDHDDLKAEMNFGKAKEDEDQGTAAFVRKGGEILESLTRARHDLEKEFPTKTKGVITKKLGLRKEALTQLLLDTAVACGLVSGKWMLFCDPSEVNDVWEVIAKATVKDELGIAAKVAPDSGEERQMRLICVYTKNFKDVEDVKRVVAKLKNLGVVGPKGIYYKCDAYTYLDIKSGNEYGIKPSMYSSTEIMKAKGKGIKLEK